MTRELDRPVHAMSSLPTPPRYPHALSPRMLARSPPLSSLAHVQDGRTPLHYAAMIGHTATAALLLEKGADVHAKNNVSGGCRDVWAPSARHSSPYSSRDGCCVCIRVSVGAATSYAYPA